MPEIKLIFVDRGDCQEAFADSPRVVGWSADGVMHIELRAIRRQGQDSQGEESAVEFPVIRGALTLQTATALYATLAHHLGELEKSGMIKRTPPMPPAPDVPNKH